MTLHDIERAQLVDASTWAQQNGLQIIWGNGQAKDPHAQPSMVWKFRAISQERLTGATVVHTGTVDASIYVPAGTAAQTALELAESLLSLFRGRVYAGSVTLDESSIGSIGREGSSWRVNVSIPWEWDEKRIPQAAIGLYEIPGAVIAYQAVRQLWEQRVRAPLQLTTYFDNEPPQTATPPFVIARFRTLQPVAVELRTLRIPGRVLASVHHPLGSGLEDGEIAVSRMVEAFDECTYRGIVFGTPISNRIGRTSINTWQANVRLPFYYEVRT